VIGSIGASGGDKFPTFLVILGVVLILVGIVLSTFEGKKNGKES
jgi:uncharacterized surface anchored protein